MSKCRIPHLMPGDVMDLEEVYVSLEKELGPDKAKDSPVLKVIRLANFMLEEGEKARSDAECARTDEREQCAKIAEMFGPEYVGDFRVEQGPEIADEIRARGHD